MRFSATDLPASLKLDATTGIITGTTPGTAARCESLSALRTGTAAIQGCCDLVVGETLALTPPMGWNDWYTHYDRMTEQDCRARPRTP